MIDITLLGTGAAIPAPERGLSAALLRCGGRAVLFDCGEGTQTSLRRAKLSPVKIDLVALTHYHGDHIFGLPGLLQSLSLLGRTAPLYITGPEGLEEAMAPILTLAGELSYAVELTPLAYAACDMRRFNDRWPRNASLTPFPTEHRAPSRGYVFSLDRLPLLDTEKAEAMGIPKSQWKRIQEDSLSPIAVDGKPLYDEKGAVLRGIGFVKEYRKGLRTVFSGDTTPCGPLRDRSRGADLLIHDATYAEDEAEARLWGHSTFRQAAELARDSAVKRLLLTHFSQAIKEPRDYLDNARSVFPNTDCGFDGMTVTLRYEAGEQH